MTNSKNKNSYVLIAAFLLFFGYQLLDSFIYLPPASLILIDIFFFLILPIFLFIWLYLKEKDAFNELLQKIKPDKTYKSDLVLGFILGVIYVVVVTIFSYSLFARNALIWLKDYDMLTPFFSPHHPPNSLFSSNMGLKIYAGLSAGIIEELFYKAILFYLLVKKQQDIKKFVFISLLLFISVHLEQGLLVAFFCAGLFFALPTTLYFSYRKNIFLLIILHSTSDLIFFLR